MGQIWKHEFILDKRETNRILNLGGRWHVTGSYCLSGLRLISRIRNAESSESSCLLYICSRTMPRRPNPCYCLLDQQQCGRLLCRKKVNGENIIRRYIYVKHIKKQKTMTTKYGSRLLWGLQEEVYNKMHFCIIFARM